MSDSSTNKKKTTSQSGLSFHPPSEIDVEKREFLAKVTAATGAVGSLAVAVPFVGSMLPSERAKAAGAPVEEDISMLAPGEIKTAEWRGKPVWIIHRTDEMNEDLAKNIDQLSDPDCEVPQQPVYCENSGRSIKPNIGVLVGICTHLGCSPTTKLGAGGDMGEDWVGGFFCPCHGSKFDLAGRVFKGSPAPTNLIVPPYSFLDDNTLLIGVDAEMEA